MMPVTGICLELLPSLVFQILAKVSPLCASTHHCCTPGKLQTNSEDPNFLLPSLQISLSNNLIFGLQQVVVTMSIVLVLK